MPEPAVIGFQSSVSDAQYLLMCHVIRSVLLPDYHHINATCFTSCRR